MALSVAFPSESAAIADVAEPRTAGARCANSGIDSSIGGVM
jgi:hypothetical protein